MSTVTRFLAKCGVSSRRKAQDLVFSGRVRVNGEVATSATQRVGAADRVQLDGALVRAHSAPPARLWRYHKPHGDADAQPPRIDRPPDGTPHLHLIGPLGVETEGLLLLTNSPSLKRTLEHPSSVCVRRYWASLNTGRRTVTSEMVQQLAAGVELIDGRRFKPIRVEVEARDEDLPRRVPGARTSTSDFIRTPTYKCAVTMFMTEGKLHEIRRVWQHYGFSVVRLIRQAYGPFELGSLQPGRTEEVDPKLVRAVLKGEIPLDSPDRTQNAILTSS
ncbi:hypothetical protein AB1Y20_011426 [Prymnesium parvum]|uniref:RNA-binding S4 domain-containing protein n=1 Tax=Prymnesium parvum TaxID=97485 RepID=A0AB34IMT6_PRYPA